MRYNFIITMVVVFLLDYALTITLLDWRLAILAGAIGGLLYTNRLRSFLAGFTGILLAWLAMMVPLLMNKNNQAIVGILSSIVGFPDFALIGLVLIIPSLVGALSCLATTSLRIIISR